MDKLKGLLYGSFLGDAMALGPHWIYDTDLIRSEFGNIAGITTPPCNSYHVGKLKGDFTHYGDQALMLLKSIKDMDGYNQMVFKKEWLEYMKNYKGYKDHATKASIELLTNSDCGSDSDELGGFARLAPIIYKYHNDKDLLQFVKSNLRMTHNNEELVEKSLFIVKLIQRILDGKNPLEGIRLLYGECSSDIKNTIDVVEKHIKDDPVEYIRSVGQSCSSRFAFKAVLYLVLKYKDDYHQAILKNLYAGGDSAARGMVLGMILGAHMGYDQLPQTWMSDMNDISEINSLS
ncbi:ADP-ribosylglycohydrolase family protein [Vallitalea okinawensis]|uniref:ADP-ribosylglycohydrolase family protein n=1 Tax=Vallitalea okinawensis TaxID=2078660 RepID=UPI000CFAB5E1|nr:ADP-ribosylglycohydrolase family protein [Vallitalea okinawensis]